RRLTPGERARSRARGRLVSPTRAGTDPHRTRRHALPHRARSLHEARSRAYQAHRQPRTSQRRIARDYDAGHWLTPRLGEFLDLYPDIRINLITTDEELDLAMREADVAIRLRQPTQPDLIQRKLFSVHSHVYGSPEYLKRFGTPRTIEEIDGHR